MLNASQQIMLQSQVDQENAFFADCFSIDDYLEVLLLQISSSIESVWKASRDHNCGATATLTNINVMDLYNILRLAQCKLAEIALRTEADHGLSESN